MKNKKKLAALAVEALKKDYPESLCSLEYGGKPYELLISVRLAAQCTDARVNIVTRDLFREYPTLESFAQADPKAVREIVAPCGLGNTKAKDIVAMAGMLTEQYGGVVPDNMDDLLRLPGVGRKTANLILGDVYHQPAVVCDTHCIRIAGRLGLTASKNAAIVEKDLWAALDPAESNDFCHRLVLHGRAVCRARGPLCENCSMSGFCEAYGAEQKKNKQKKESKNQ